MNPKDILVIGTKGSLVAFQRDTGRKLWSVHLKGGDFVTLLVDEKRVYAHTKGELFCVDLFSGDGVWSDELKGFGYGVAALALPGLPSSNIEAVVEIQRQQAAAAAATTTAST